MKSFFCCLCLLALAACKNDPGNSRSIKSIVDHNPAIRPAVSWVVLLDMSGVRDSADTRQQYALNMAKVMDSVMAGDHITVALITESSVNELELLLDWGAPPFTKAENDYGIILQGKIKNHNLKVKKFRDSLAGNLSEFILSSQRITPRTDIINAIHLAANSFTQHPAQQRILVLLSDMEEVTDRYNFTRDRLDEQRIEEIISLEKKSPRGIPSLKEVRVYVGGAQSINADGTPNSDRFYRVRNFWMRYFSECETTLANENYGAVLPPIALAAK